MKKILIFSTAYLPMIGGAEIAVKEITERIPDYQFDLICAKIKKGLAEREKIDAIDVWRLGAGWGKLDKFLLPWRGVKLASWLYRQKKYDAVWAVMASFGGLAALFFKKKFLQVPYLLTLQEGDSPEHIHSRARWLGLYYRQIFQKADFITAISQYLKDFALKQGAICPVEVVPNGVDLNKFKVQSSKFKDTSQNLKIKLNIKEGEKIIIHHGRLVPKNGLADLVEAISLLPIIGCQVPVRLLLIGGGYQEKILKKKVKNLSLEDKVLFLGEMPHEEMPKYLAISDIFIRPSLSEGLGNVFLEAMAVGVPVIGTSVGGIPDFLRDKETGLFCQVRNPRSIAEKINLLLFDENLRQKLIVNGKKLIENNYDWNKIANQMENIFNKLCV